MFEKNVRNETLKLHAFEDKHIFSIEISENGIAYGKKSHVKYDVYIKPKVIKPLKEYDNDILRLSYTFNYNLKELLSERNIMIE